MSSLFLWVPQLMRICSIHQLPKGEWIDEVFPIYHKVNFPAWFALVCAASLLLCKLLCLDLVNQIQIPDNKYHIFLAKKYWQLFLINLFLGALLMMEGWIYRARASGGVRFVSQPDVQQEPHQFHPQGTRGVVGMTPSTCATAVRFLPQIDVQQVAPLQAVPPIDTASGITPGENFQDGIYMRNKGNHIPISPCKVPAHCASSIW